jgi:hypothetical protein
VVCCDLNTQWKCLDVQLSAIQVPWRSSTASDQVDWRVGQPLVDGAGRNGDGRRSTSSLAGKVRQLVVEDGAGHDGAERWSSSELGRRKGRRRSAVPDRMWGGDWRRLMGRAAEISVGDR